MTFKEASPIFRQYIHPDDYLSVYSVWEKAGEGIHISFSDHPDELKKLIERNSNLIFIAEIDNQIIGTVMGGFDGRRGIIYHLAVIPEFQKKGVGTGLMKRVEEDLIRVGCRKVYLFVVPEKPELAEYYQNLGYEKMNVLPFTKILVD